MTATSNIAPKSTISALRRAPSHRYLAEFDFRYNNRTALGVNDSERATNMLKGISGKRLTYRRINEGEAA